ncbi:MAG TPA: hypothetical protein VK464_01320 [Symbiobacteriaceae bacterium]|nr:hypothetical protein [Symbiobacteriaceae bacterium]
MLAKFQQVAQEGTIQIHHAYLGHIKKDEDRKILAHAEVLAWENADTAIKAILEQHLYQAIEGMVGEVNFPCMYTGEVLSVAKVASEEFDRTKNRPAVEVLESIREMKEFAEDQLIEYGNTIAYKVLAAGAIKNHLVAIMKLSIVPQLGAAPVAFVFGTVVDLDDREESLFDENKGKFVTTELNNVIKKGAVSRAVFFPCLDDQGREMADLLVYAGSGAGAWFKALEASRRFSPRKEGQALVRMITEQTTGGEVPHDLFKQMGEELSAKAHEGLYAEQVAQSLEKAMGQGIDRLGFQARWESSFGDLSYRPTYESLFGGTDVEKPTKLKMQAGDIQINLTPAHLEHFRQITVGDKTFIAFAVPDQAKVVVGKDLDLHIKPVDVEQLRRWLTGQTE